MRAEHAPVRMELVDHDVAEVLEERRPFGVMRQDPRVEHVGIREDEVRAGADGPPRVLGRVAVIGEHPHLRQLPRELFELGQLVLGERLRGKQIEHARVRLVHERLERRQVVTECLAGGGGRDDHQVMALLDQLPRPCLVRVELGDPPRAQRFADPRVERGRKRHQDGRTGREVTGRRDARPCRR